MLYSFSTACQSKYCICNSWKRSVRARFWVQRRPVPVWNLSSWAFCTNLPLDCQFLYFHLSKPIYSLSQLVVISICCIYLEVTCKCKVQSPRCPNQQNQQKHLQVQLKRFKKNLAHMKSLQAQNKNKTQKSFSNHLRHNLCQVCSCPTLKVLRWIGQWMMVYTTDSWNSTWNVRMCQSVSLPWYQKKDNARRLLLGVVILEWISVFPGACPVKS